MKVAFYLRVSTDDQTIENQRRDLDEVAKRLGWDVVAVFADEGVSGTKGRDERPQFDELMKGVARKDFEMIAAWSVCRIGRSLVDLVTVLSDVRDKGIDLYFHKQGLETTTSAGRMMYQLLGIFSEYEREIIRSRVISGIERKRAENGGQWGRPTIGNWKTNRIKKQLKLGKGIREVARMVSVSPGTVSKIKKEMVAEEAP